MRIILALIIVLAAFLRIYALGSVPPAPSLDEVSIAYNAFSIGKTGRDEYGYLLPLLLRSYDDWRPAGYVYAVMPLTMIFGLDEVAVRLPSALMGVLSVFLIYILAGDIYRAFRPDGAGKPKKPNQNNTGVIIGLASAFFMAINPWSIYINRLGHEANYGFLLTLGLLVCALRYIVTTRTRWLYAGAVCLGLSFNSYQSQKILMPVILTGLVLFFRRHIDIKKVIYPAGLALLIAAPAIYVSLQPDGRARFTATNILNNHPQYEIDRENYLKAKQRGDTVVVITNHRFVTGLKIIAENYTKHLKSDWLFAGREKEDHKAPGSGLLYRTDAVFLAIGVIWLAITSAPVLGGIIGLYLISILPGGLTSQAPHAMRTMVTIIPLALIFGYGLAALANMKKKRPEIFAVFVFAALLIVNLPVFFRHYFRDFPRLHSGSFQYALNRAFDDIVSGQKVHPDLISNRDNLYQSYMFYLFHSKKNPADYIAQGGTLSGGFNQAHRIDGMEFNAIDKDRIYTSGTVLLGNPDEFDSRYQVLERYYQRDGAEGVWLVRTK